ncbi:MAG: 50S ribosomal protein L6 [Nanoarchaeota archaeon]|nr:50S ribosomal protein L6 [Nanoarchaeota archaeon]
MKKSLTKETKIPEGVEIKVHGDIIIVKGREGELKRKFDLGKIKAEVKDNKIILKDETASKKEKKIMNTVSAHLKNMIIGVKEKYEYKLKVCSSHFPIGVDVQGRNVSIKNFLGEKIPRKTKLPEGVEAKVNKEFIIITSCDKELAGQAASKFEEVTKIKDRDRRIFQDGIFMITKAGREI